MIPRSYLAEYFDKGVPGGWTVPVHRRCHRELQRSSDNLPFFIEELVDELRDGLGFAQVTEPLHVDGNFWTAALATRRYAAEVSHPPTSSEAWANEAQESRYGAGTNRARRWSSRYARHHIRESRRVDVLLGLANMSANAGLRTKAERALSEADALIGGSPPDLLQSAYLRRAAQVRREPAIAESAMRASEPKTYSWFTARMIAASIRQERDPFRARDLYDEVFDVGGTLSWLYRAQSWFGLACCSVGPELRFSRADRRLALQRLYAAQYVLVMLGLLGVAFPTIPLADTAPVHMPGDLLMALAESLDVTMAECIDLRQSAIADRGLRVAVLNCLNPGSRPASSVSAWRDLDGT
jgi:hypothetical protein